MRVQPRPARRRSRLTALAACALALAASGTVAEAAQAKAFDLWTSTSLTPGRAHGYGQVTFITNRRVRVSGHINDICPADGYGAYVELKVNFVGGGYATTVRSDTATCGGGAKGYRFTTPRFPRRVKSVGVTVIELDNDNGQITPGDAARKLLRRG
jgi:hypothetical protein